MSEKSTNVSHLWCDVGKRWQLFRRGCMTMSSATGGTPAVWRGKWNMKNKTNKPSARVCVLVTNWWPRLCRETIICQPSAVRRIRVLGVSRRDFHQDSKWHHKARRHQGPDAALTWPSNDITHPVSTWWVTASPMWLIQSLPRRSDGGTQITYMGAVRAVAAACGFSRRRVFRAEARVGGKKKTR